MYSHDLVTSLHYSMCPHATGNHIHTIYMTTRFFHQIIGPSHLVGVEHSPNQISRDFKDKMTLLYDDALTMLTNCEQSQHFQVHPKNQVNSIFAHSGATDHFVRSI